MTDEYRKLIADEFLSCVKSTIGRIEDNEETYRPFHAALLSDDVLLWSRFERSFSTSFGQRVIEEIARLVALSNGATEAIRQKETYITLDSAILEKINRHIEEIRNGKQDRAWEASLDSIRQTPLSGKPVDVRVISDLWWKKDGIENFMSIKTVKPNIDQTTVAKTDCLKLTLFNPSYNTYFGLPYNPYGENKSDYAHNPPMGIFDFHNDKVVLIGKEMWDTIGGVGCYEEVLEIVKAVGPETKKLIETLKR